MLKPTTHVQPHATHVACRRCHYLDSDPFHCGACGQACPTDPNGAPICSPGGQCTITCNYPLYVLDATTGVCVPAPPNCLWGEDTCNTNT